MQQPNPWGQIGRSHFPAGSQGSTIDHSALSAAVNGMPSTVNASPRAVATVNPYSHSPVTPVAHRPPPVAQSSFNLPSCREMPVSSVKLHPGLMQVSGSGGDPRWNQALSTRPNPMPFDTRQLLSSELKSPQEIIQNNASYLPQINHASVDCSQMTMPQPLNLNRDCARFENVNPAFSQPQLHSRTMALDELADVSMSQQKMPLFSAASSPLIVHQPDTSPQVSSAAYLDSEIMKSTHDPHLAQIRSKRNPHAASLPAAQSQSPHHILQPVIREDALSVPNSVNPNEILHEMQPVPKKVPDDEFAHLAEDGHVSAKSTPARKNPEKKEESPPNPKTPAPPAFKKTSFQDSFLSFITGGKSETLSSVTSTPAKKPTLPKYDPGLCPKRVAADPKPPPTQKTPKIVPVHKNSTLAKKEQTKQVVQPKNVEPKAAPTPKGKEAQDDSGYCDIIITGEKEKSSKVAAKKRPGPKSNTPAASKQPKKKVKEPEIITPRRASTRKAKVKAEQKRKASRDDDDSDYVPFSDSDNQEEYDSDKDPGWNPNAKEESRHHASSGSDNDVDKIIPARSTKKKLSTVKERSKEFKDGRKLVIYPGKPDNLEANLDYDEAHFYPKGAFVISRKDLANYENFPIWKIEAGRLLQKFELHREEDNIVHRSLPTYSSYNEDIYKNYKAIEVTIVSANVKNEVVQVFDKYRPHPPDDSLECDDLMPVFNIYLQTLFSHALEPTFLKTIGGGSADDYDLYLGPIKTIEDLLSARIDIIISKTNWVEDFLAALNKLPVISVNRSVRPSEKCQLLPHNMPVEYEVILQGPEYDAQFLTTPDPIPPPTKFCSSKVGIRFVKHYHHMKHFKYTMSKLCALHVKQLKVKKPSGETSAYLDECMQNRSWAHMHFRILKELLSRPIEI